MKPGTLIIIGVVAVVIGLMPPVGMVCVAGGLFCLYMGCVGLDKEAKQQEVKHDDVEDKDE